MNLFSTRNINQELTNYNTIIKDDAIKNNKKNYLLADDIVSVKSLRVPEDFKKHKAKQHKITNALRFYVENGYFNSPVSVIAETNEHGNPNTLLIVDGVSRYVAARRLDVKEIPIKYIDINTYCSERNI